MGNALDSKKLKEKADELAKEHNNKKELGEKFLADKEKIDNEMERVENASISDEDKKKLKDILKSAMDQLVEQYDTEITEEQHRIEERESDLIHEAEEAAEEKRKIADEFDGDDSGDSGALHLSDAANEARAQQEEFERIRSAQAERIKLQMEQAQIQRNEMRKKQWHR